MRAFLHEQWQFLRLSITFILADVTENLLEFMTLIFAGHISQSHLEGVGLANTLFTLLVYPISAGFASVFDTYGPQVHGGNGELGTVFLSCLYQGWLMILIALGTYLNTVHIIHLLPDSGLYSAVEGENGTFSAGEDFKEIAISYMRMTAVNELLTYAVTVLSRYFIFQEKVRLSFFVSIVMVVSNLLANYILVVVLKLGLVGLALASILSRSFTVAISLAICYVMIKRAQFVWNGFSTRALLGWKPMLKLGLSGALGVFAEVTMFEVATFCSQFVGATTFSVVIIMHQLITIKWSIALGMARAGATIVGNAMVEENTEKTKKRINLVIWNGIIASIVLAVLAYILRSYEVALFSSELHVKRLFTASFWIVCLGIPVDHVQTSLNQGILVAFGAQSFTARTMTVACFLMGLPIALGTIFMTGLKATGVFIGVIVANLFMLVTAAIKMRTVDLQAEIDKVRERVAGNEEPSLENEDTKGIMETAFVEKEGEKQSESERTDEETIGPRGNASPDTSNSTVSGWKRNHSLHKGDDRNINEICKVILAFFCAAILTVSLSLTSLIRK